MRNNYYIYIMLLAFFTESYAYSNSSFELSTSKTKANIGEKLSLSLILSTPKENEIVIHPIKLSDSMMIIRNYKNDTSYAGGNRIIQIKMDFSSLNGANYYIAPQIALLNKPKHQDPIILKSNGLNIEFVEMKVDTNLPAKSHYGEAATSAKNDMPINYIYLLIFLFISILAISYYYYTKRSKQIIVDNPDKSLIFRIHKLCKNKNGNPEKLIELYAELSAILNEWICSVLEVNSCENQTEAIVNYMEANLTPDLFHQLGKAKRRIELVQFAKKAPIVSEFKEDCKAVELVIKSKLKANE